MKLKIIVIGKTKQAFVKDGMSYYFKRLRPLISLEWLELEHSKSKKTEDRDHQRKIEAELVLKRLDPTDYLVLLDEMGKEFNSVSLSNFIDQKILTEGKKMVMLVGGAYGFESTLKKRANSMISLSKMTFSHQLVRLVLLEQVYRSMCIVKGHPYHHQ